MQREAAASVCLRSAAELPSNVILMGALTFVRSPLLPLLQQ